MDAAGHRVEDLEVDRPFRGPAIIESPFTTVVVDDASTFVRTSNGSLVVTPERNQEASS